MGSISGAVVLASTVTLCHVNVIDLLLHVTAIQLI